MADLGAVVLLGVFGDLGGGTRVFASVFLFMVGGTEPGGDMGAAEEVGGGERGEAGPEVNVPLISDGDRIQVRYSVEAQSAREDIANALQIVQSREMELWALDVERLLRNALRKLDGRTMEAPR